MIWLSDRLTQKQTGGKFAPFPDIRHEPLEGNFSMTVLLALSNTRQSEKAIDLALNRIENSAGGRLQILFVLDTEIPKQLFSQLTDRGFIGEKPSDQLAKAIMEDYRKHAKDEIGRIAQKAAKRSVEFDSEIVEGIFADEAIKAVEKHQPDLLIVARKKRSRLARFLTGSAVDNLRAQSPCPVEVVEN